MTIFLMVSLLIIRPFMGPIFKPMPLKFIVYVEQKQKLFFYKFFCCRIFPDHHQSLNDGYFRGIYRDRFLADEFHRLSIDMHITDPLITDQQYISELNFYQLCAKISEYVKLILCMHRILAGGTFFSTQITASVILRCFISPMDGSWHPQLFHIMCRCWVYCVYSMHIANAMHPASCIEHYDAYYESALVWCLNISFPKECGRLLFTCVYLTSSCNSHAR